MGYYRFHFENALIDVDAGLLMLLQERQIILQVP